MSTTELNHIKDKIREILVFLINRDKSIAITANDIKDDTGLSNNPDIPLNSITAMRLLVEIEKEFNIEIPDDSLTMENFININAVSRFITGIIYSTANS